ncbi:MAG: 2-hydroxyacyl-CoA dehydratase family protein, partial [Deltaproteobacteria bacterium]|nr:2-hydroxyacyl-CoA dehydratase family protein [Deltaproteobacteria bacterium]
MMKEYFQNLVSGIEASLAEKPESKSPRKVYTLELARLGQRLYSETHPVAWCGVVAPFDLLAAMGITSCFVEFIGAMLSATGTVETFLEEAEQAGYAGDTCGYHRSVIGAAQKGLMPEPEFLIGTTCPCTGGLAAMENLAHYFKKDLFVLNVPQAETPEGVRYLTDQIRDMVQFVSQHTGKSLDKDRLQEAIANSNQAREIMLEIYGLARQVPSPATARELSNFGIVMPLFFGTPAAVHLAQTFRDEFLARSENGTAGIPDERLRLMWIQNRIQFKNPFISVLENDYHAAVVIDELNDVTWDFIDPNKPYEGLANRIISIPFNGEVRHRIGHLQKLARNYRIDGAINPCHWGCRQGTGARG